MVSKRVESLLNQLRTQGIIDERVLNAIAMVPREKFVDEAFEHKAWENTALPIGQGQTISQPYMVARMTELLTLTPESRVLEIGTGSGYQTAILAHLVHHVCSVERIRVCSGTRAVVLNNLIYIMFQPVTAMDGRVGRRVRRSTRLSLPPRRRKFRPLCWRSWTMAAYWCCRLAKSISS